MAMIGEEWRSYWLSIKAMILIMILIRYPKKKAIADDVSINVINVEGDSDVAYIEKPEIMSEMMAEIRYFMFIY